MHRPRHRAAAATVAGAITLALASTTASASRPPQHEPPAPTWSEVTVHDPSVVSSGDDVWIFGSHGASAYSTDLMNWTQNTVDLSQNPDNALFDDIYAELAEAFAWAQTETLWASDVIQLPDGRFAMYYNACEGSSPRAALGLAVADDVEGPYTNVEVFLKSGMWGEESENAGEIYDATIHPNTVDPDAFYDTEGNLWMVYGSYSGGIFILQLDPATGLPYEGQGYGTHLVGGNHARIEGPTIRYDEETGYYYLFLSFGGLDASGGYEVRVARSESPDGPYVDAEGNEMSEAAGAPGTLFDDASIEPYGLTVLDGHLFTREVGDPGTGSGFGYVSAGHNTWYDDPETGKSFLIFHTRFPGTGEVHEVRVHQMYMNTEGWPVISPMRYAGETNDRIKNKDVVGSWQLTALTSEISPDPAPTTEVTLRANGRITGDAQGRWRLTSQHDAEIVIDGVTYTGVFTPTWDPMREEWSTGLTVASASGESLWGRQVVTLSGRKAVDAVLVDLDLGDTSALASDLTLPTTGTSGTTISWESSNPAILSETGEVTRPAAGEDDAQITLTATAVNGRATGSVDFAVTVLARTPAQLSGQWSFEDDLSDAVTGGSARTTGAVLGTEPTTAVTYTDDGVDGKAVHLDGTVGIQLPNELISSTEYSVSMWLRPAAHTPFTTAFFGATDGDHWISLVPLSWDGGTMLWSGSQPSYFDGATGTLIPTEEWTHVVFVVEGASATIYLDGEQAFAGSGMPDRFSGGGGIFALGVNWWDAPYQGDIDSLSVWSSALTPEDVAELTA